MKATQMYAVSDTGLVRDHNEDCVCIQPEFGFAVLADGLGGHAAGEVASRTAVEAISSYLIHELSRITQSGPEQGFSRLLRQAIAMANARVRRIAEQQPACTGMGTTVVLALFLNGRITVAHVGDSRAYRLRSDILSAMTEDHSFVQEQVNRGLMSADEARLSPYRHLVSSAVGLDMEVQASVTEDFTRPEDIYLICSDGLSDVIPDEIIHQSLLQADAGLEKKASALVRLANATGGPDNTSVILVRTG